MQKPILPQLITFDGEARSGKGTVVQGTKDYLRDSCGYKTMLIDAGQVFRALVVAATRAGVDLDNPQTIDVFLGDEHEAEKCVKLIKDIYHMTKNERDALLYTNEVGRASAHIGARPKSQEFKDTLLHKWLRDAAIDGYDVVLLDGRALEETAHMLEREHLCRFALGLYFICDTQVGAMRTLGFADHDYEKLSPEDAQSVDALMLDIDERNRTDAERSAQPLVRPIEASTAHLPGKIIPGFMFHIIDTSATMLKDEMILPVAEYAEHVLSLS